MSDHERVPTAAEMREIEIAKQLPWVRIADDREAAARYSAQAVIYDLNYIPDVLSDTGVTPLDVAIAIKTVIETGECWSHQIQRVVIWAAQQPVEVRVYIMALLRGVDARILADLVDVPEFIEGMALVDTMAGE